MHKFYKSHDCCPSGCADLLCDYEGIPLLKFFERTSTTTAEVENCVMTMGPGGEHLVANVWDTTNSADGDSREKLCSRSMFCPDTTLLFHLIFLFLQLTHLRDLQFLTWWLMRAPTVDNPWAAFDVEDSSHMQILIVAKAGGLSLAVRGRGSCFCHGGSYSISKTSFRFPSGTEIFCPHSYSTLVNFSFWTSSFLRPRRVPHHPSVRLGHSPSPGKPSTPYAATLDSTSTSSLDFTLLFTPPCHSSTHILLLSAPLFRVHNNDPQPS